MKFKKTAIMALSLCFFAANNASANEKELFNFVEFGGAAANVNLVGKEDFSDFGFNVGVGKRDVTASKIGYVYSLNYLKVNELTVYSGSISYAMPVPAFDGLIFEIGANTAINNLYSSTNFAIGAKAAIVAPLSYFGVPASNRYAVKFYTNVSAASYKASKFKTGLFNGVDSGVALEYHF